MPISPKADKQRWPLSTLWPSHLVTSGGGRRSLEREEQLSLRKSRLSQPRTPREAAMLPPVATALTPAPRSRPMMAQAPAVPTWHQWSAALFPMILGNPLWRKLPQWWPRQLKLSRTDSPDDKLRTCLGNGIWGGKNTRKVGVGEWNSTGNWSLALWIILVSKSCSLQVLPLGTCVPQPRLPAWSTLQNSEEDVKPLSHWGF